jgi:hypothetical protein
MIVLAVGEIHHRTMQTTMSAMSVNTNTLAGQKYNEKDQLIQILRAGLLYRIQVHRIPEMGTIRRTVQM